MERRIGRVGQHNKGHIHIFVPKSCFSLCSDDYFLNQEWSTIALFQDVAYAPANGLDVVATKWKDVLVELDSTTRDIYTYSYQRVAFRYAAMIIS